MTVVRVPGSSANLGPGFDAVGMALGIYAEVGLVGQSADGFVMPANARVADDHHPATVAFRAAGGEGTVWVRSEIPMGRGLGFSGAVRVGGALLGVMTHDGFDGTEKEAQQRVLDITSRLEGHADNVAASLLGGVVGTNGAHAARVPLGCDLEVVVWIPSFTTSTSESRGRLPATVNFEDAVFNVTHTALLLAALAAGDVDALAAATADRLHQDVRLAKAEPSRAAMAAMLGAGAIAAWLSGSGPTVACFVRPGTGRALLDALPTDGRGRVLRIDGLGARVCP